MENIILHYQDIIILHDQKQLTIGNSKLKRVFDLSCGFPRTISLTDASHRELAGSDKVECDCSVIGFNRPGHCGSEYEITRIDARVVGKSFLDSEHVVVQLDIVEHVQQMEVIREYIIYPGFPAISVRNQVKSAVMPNIYWTRRGGLDYQEGNLRRGTLERLESCADSIRLIDELKPECSVEFIGRTDYHCEQVRKHEVRSDGEYPGNLLYLTDSAGAGILFLQEAPASSERRDFEPYDFRYLNHEIFSCNWGIFPSEFRPGKYFTGYRHDLILFSDSSEREYLLKEFLAKRFLFDHENQSPIMLNPWGSNSFPQLLNEKFLVDEIQAAKTAGANCYQIDDGWQQGKDLCELFVRNKHIEPSFWDISQTRLNGTFEPFVKTAQQEGIQLGLWLAPSSNCEYRNWRDFVKLIMKMYHDYGITMFKIDAMLLRTSESEKNLRNMLHQCRKLSNGKIMFNLDTTNGQRSGYFMLLEYGNVFLENRYVRSVNGNVGYHPEKVLRSLWRLSKYIRLQSLQIEIPSPEDFLPNGYAGKYLVSPLDYSLEYWAAIALFANPLLWFAPSTQSQEVLARFKAMMDLHLRYRETIFSGEIFPVGDEPDGAAICGFQSHQMEQCSGIVILYKEHLAGSSGEIQLQWVEEKTALHIVHGQGKCAWADGKVQVAFADDCDFLIFRY